MLLAREFGHSGFLPILKSSDTHLEMSTTVKGTQKLLCPDNSLCLPCPTLQVEWGVAFITFNPGSAINIMIDTFSARKVLFLQVLSGECHNTAHKASPVKVNFFKCLPPGSIDCGVMVLISHLNLK